MLSGDWPDLGQKSEIRTNPGHSDIGQADIDKITDERLTDAVVRATLVAAADQQHKDLVVTEARDTDARVACSHVREPG